MLIGLVWPGSVSAQTSAFCPTPFTATITSGGSATFDVSNCDGSFDGGMSDGPPATPPTSGTYVIGPNSGGFQQVTYTHDGISTDPTDSFTLLDEENDLVLFSITITPSNSAIVVTPASLPALTAGTPFSVTLASDGGQAPYSYALGSGALPAGLSLNAAGVLSGTPTARGGYSFGVRSEDSTGESVVKSYAGTVQNPSLTLVPATAIVQQGAAFSESLSTLGGVAPYSYQLETGSLPAGVMLSSAGVLSGSTAAPVGDYPVTIRVTDSSAGGGSYFEVEAFTLTVSQLPALSIGDVALAEGDAGTTAFEFTVNLSAPAGAGGVSFDIATADGTAVAGEDYVARSLGAQSIPAGASSYTFSVAVTGDTLNEADETFFVNVGNVSGAVVADGQGLGTILNDDPLPSLAIGDVTVVEGNTGMTIATFAVALNVASGRTVTVGYATADGTASAPADYLATSGTLTFAPGITSLPIAVSVVGDIVPEADETFFVNLGAPVNATLADAQGLGTIVDDDVPVEVGPPTLPSAAVAAGYSQSIVASGGTGPYTFAVSAGALPAGLSLATNGTLAGTPTAGGSFTFTVTATDSSPVPGPFTASRAYSISVAPAVLVLPTSMLPAGTLGVGYAAAITPASGGTAPYTYAVTSGTLPAGLAIDASSGAITGAPSALGDFDFSVTATDTSTGSGPYTVTQTYRITVVDAAPVANPVAFAVAYGAPATAVTLDITGGAATSVSLGTLPASGTAVATGTGITYQPAAGFAGTDAFTYLATNSGGTSAPALVTVTVSAPVVSIAPGVLPDLTVAQPYSQTLSASGAVAPYTFAVTAGALPAGLALSDAGALSGAPTAAGTFSIGIVATDANGQTGTRTYTLLVQSPQLGLTPGSGPLTAPYATPFSQAFGASGGVGPYGYSVTGALPPGLTFVGDTLSGTPTAPGSYAFDITVTDSGATGVGAPFSLTRSYTLEVPQPAITITPPALPDATAGVAYAQALSAGGGVAPYLFSVSGGALPAGLNLTGEGRLSGTPTATGTYTFSVAAADANGQSATRTYAMSVAVPALTMTPETLADSTAGSPYRQQFTAAGGIPGYRYMISAGVLPAGLALAQDTGVVSGTPTQAGRFSFSITATDSTGGTPGSVTVAYTLAVSAPLISIEPETLPQAQTTLAYSQTLVARGGTAPYTYGVASGALPAGLALSTGGVLSGAPTVAGSFTVSIQATDALGFTGTRTYVLGVIERPDPTRDPEVRGLLDAQAAATRRFATSQLDNFQQRLEQLHGGHASGVHSALAFTARELCAENRFHAPDSPCGMAARQRRQNEDVSGPFDDGGPGSGNAGAPAASGSGGRIGYWIGGTLRSGNHDGQAGARGFDFETEGVSAGADMRVHPLLVIGAGLGYGQDSTSIGRNGSHLRGNARTLALYASLQPGGTFFVDGVLGYQALSYDVDRFLAGGSIARGRRDGDQRMASIALGADLVGGQWQHTPYARVDAMRGTLDGYVEHGGGVHDLAYGEQDVDTTTGSLGLRSAFRRVTGWGAFAPQLRIEYQHDLDADATTSMQYADLLGPVYVTGVRGYDRSRLLLGFGASFQFTGYSLQFDYRGLVGSGEQRDSALQLMFRTGR
ncbi:putative Ig domain-containing protein [Luteimonas sp. SJ-16]|uniref:Putative Ig domain-containing protein n=1 Tax=Luteimonas deserti TaxID=2752306 RepID=A0A7Z0TT11_9GAMM|nr:putative Ig domain-containing protein [Luteimonas deserti]NYZ61326.1 putative Ig domain-containing protein [Luteimonas deserti]